MAAHGRGRSVRAITGDRCVMSTASRARRSSAVQPVDVWALASCEMPWSFADRCRLLDTAAWSRRTRLEGWDVAALAAHHSLLVQGLGFLAAQPVHEAAEIQTARGMLRRFNEPSGLASTAASAVAEMARQQAATSTAEELVAVFVTAAPAVVASLRGYRSDRRR